MYFAIREIFLFPRSQETQFEGQERVEEHVAQGKDIFIHLRARGSK